MNITNSLLLILIGIVCYQLAMYSQLRELEHKTHIDQPEAGIVLIYGFIALIVGHISLFWNLYIIIA